MLTFHLVGINNQNFVMQDQETGTWWQQVSGEAILGPLKRLFGIWKSATFKVARVKPSSVFAEGTTKEPAGLV